MISVHLQYYSQLRDLRGPESLDLAPGTTVAGLLDTLYALLPKLKQWDSCLLVAAGIEYVPREYVLKPDELISLMPPVQGG
ncbi:MAG TPA: MoaD/ThiS family protein [Chthoniobacterales bacterium]|nr:MoaD/ThiS family protein [Chthoniobacterales bacterium]